MVVGVRHSASAARIVCAACLLACLAVVAPAAAATTQFGEEGEGAGQFNEPRAVAVDNSALLVDGSAGDVYVADRNNNRVDKFSSSGVFLLAWGWGVADGQARFETCGPEASPPTVTCQRGVGGEGAGQFGENSASGVAVDSSSGLSAGDVYVEDINNHRVEKFRPDGEFVLMFGGEVNKTTKSDVCLAGGECQAGTPGLGQGEFAGQAADSIATEAPGLLKGALTGNVFVGDESRVQEFNEKGEFQSETKLEKGAEKAGFIEALAVNEAKDLYVRGAELPVGVHEYEPSGTEITLPDGPLDLTGSPGVITLGPASELFVDDRAAGRILGFDEAGVQVASIPRSEEANGLASGSASGQLYLARRIGAVQVIARPLPGPLVEGEQAVVEPVGSVTVSVSVDPENNQTKYHLDYGVGEASETATETITMAGEGFAPETVQINLKGLKPETAYYYHLVAENTAGTSVGEGLVFVTLPAVAIESESVSQITATSAKLTAVLNPLGQPTGDRFEYGPTSAYGKSVPVPDGYAGSGLQDVSFSMLLEDLAPGSIYHYRVVAHNECEPVSHPGQQCTVDGADHTFSTQAGEGEGLIDGRRWEMVSPPDKHGVTLEAIPLEGGVIQAEQDGGGLAYIAKGPVDAQPQGNRALAETQLLAKRQTPGVWSTQDIATPHEAPAGLDGDELSEYRLFSPDLSTAVLEPAGSTPLSAGASEATPYRREDGEYIALVSGCPPVTERCRPAVEEHQDVPPGTKFGGNEGEGARALGTGVELVTATPDLNHVVLRAPQSLVQGFQTGSLPGEISLFEWSAGASVLAPVSVLPDGASAISEAAPGSGAKVGEQDENTRNAVSVDGQRVVFELEEPLPGRKPPLFLRDMGRGETVQINAAQGVKEPTGSEVSHFMLGNSEDSRVFFTSTGRLTPDSTASEVNGLADLYVFEVTSSPGQPLAGSLTDLSVEATPTHSAGVGSVIGANQDASEVYFAASGAPLAGAPEGLDLYVEDYDQQTSTWTAPRFIATLSGTDGMGLGSADLQHLAARVSPNGQFLAFMSDNSLTGYDNRDVNSGERDEEVYEYDAATQKLVCASCDPTGARPAGIRDPGIVETPLLIDRPFTWAEQWLAASIPGWTSAGVVTLYQSRYLNNEGRLFFNSPADLVPGADNAKEDVYEFEPTKVGGCTPTLSSSDAVYVQEEAGSPVEGCIGLISSGTSSEESAFLDASETGEDVFFLTAAKLSPTDTDQALDVYDSHVCTTTAPCPSTTLTVSPACTTTESCRAAPTPLPEVFSAPASATFSGPGNTPPAQTTTPNTTVKQPVLSRAQQLAKALRACRAKHNRHKRAACETQARKHYAPAHKARRAARTGRKPRA
jgi:hypothetical protein